ncbi:uncharacterized protein LOC129892954 [Solanum dulcamara]|uniref:uncharacterized protein LOC129892954 n=1 Tax=Solanum dulcamara TaxID=45834 RepID=UPI00248669C2|nr:uncharacterized protein LOC129892954 [Solanum dulcamara]
MSETTEIKSDSGEKRIIYENNHPYYLSNSDSPGMTLVNSVFDGRGYPGWRRSILLSLSAKRKLGFINGTCKVPDLRSAEFEQWNCVNDMIICWISNALSKDIADSVMSFKTTKELWDSLEQRFGKSNGAKLYHLQKELTGLVQGNSDIAGYFTKVKRLWDELDGMNAIACFSYECTCDGKAKLTKSLEDQRLIQFLMGLNDVYTQARGNILMMNPLPGIDVAYSLLLQDENQREVYANTNVTPDSGSFMAVGQTNQPNNKLIAEFAAFMANRQGRYAQRLRYQPMKGTNTYQKYANPNQNQRSDKPQNKFKGKKKYDPNLSCTYCGKTGHVHDDCYRLHGFPADFEFTNSRNYQPQIKANASLTQQKNEDIGRTDFVVNDGDFEEQYSKQQIAEMMEMYKQSKLTKTGINANAVAGTILKYSNSVFNNLKQNSWIIDSGALEHMCFDPNSFLFLKPLPVPLNINLPNSFKDLSVKSPQVFGEVREGLYLLNPNTDRCRNVFNSNDVSSITKRRNPISVPDFDSVYVNVVPNVKLWHVRFFLTIVDDFSRGTWTFLLSTKSNAFPVLKSFLSMVERQFNVKVKMIRSDNALELGKGTQESAFLASQGILHQLSCGRNKFDEKATACVLLGYPLQQKGYKLLSLDKRKVFVSRDVRFHESHFPFNSSENSHTPIFFNSPSSSDHHSDLSLHNHSAPPVNDCSYPVTPLESPHNASGYIPHPESTLPNLSLSPSQQTPTEQPILPQLEHAYPSSTTSDTFPPVPITAIPRRSGRISHEPGYLRDYICNSVILTDLWKTFFDHSPKAKRYVFSSLSLHN